MCIRDRYGNLFSVKYFYIIIFLAPKQKWSPVKNEEGCLKSGHAVGLIRFVPDMVACKILCEESTLFTCFSVTFNFNTKTCFLNEADSSLAKFQTSCKSLAYSELI